MICLLISLISSIHPTPQLGFRLLRLPACPAYPAYPAYLPSRELPLSLSLILGWAALLIHLSVDFHCPPPRHSATPIYNNVRCPDETATPPWPNHACTTTFPRRRSRCLFLYSRFVIVFHFISFPNLHRRVSGASAIVRANDQSAFHLVDKTRMITIMYIINERVLTLTPDPLL